MSAEDRLAALEQRMAEIEIRTAARVQGLTNVAVGSALVAVDALAIVAMRDRALVENLLRARRLTHQAAGSPDWSAEVLKYYQLALEIADQLASSRPLGPQ